MHILYILYKFYVSSYYYTCVLILLCMRRHITMCPHTPLHVSAYSYTCMCPHAPIHVSSYSYICVLVLLYMLHVSSYSYMCPHTPIHVSSYSYMCPHPTIHVSVYLFYAEQVIVAHISMLAASKACQQQVKSACPYDLLGVQVIVARITRRERIYVCVLILLYIYLSIYTYIFSYLFYAEQIIVARITRRERDFSPSEAPPWEA